MALIYLAMCALVSSGNSTVSALYHATRMPGDRFGGSGACCERPDFRPGGRDRGRLGLVGPAVQRPHEPFAAACLAIGGKRLAVSYIADRDRLVKLDNDLNGSKREGLPEMGKGAG